jgi:O-antigen/teichoic acid export membrane protein
MGLLAASRIQKQSIPILIGWLLGARYVVFFAIPNRLIDYATDLVMQIGIPLTAHFSTLEARRDPGAMLDAWMRSSRFLQLIIWGLGIAILGLGEPFISRWLGPEYAHGGRWVIRALGLSFLLDGVAPNSGRLLVATARHGTAAATVLILSILGVPLTILLGRAFGFEGIAVAIFLIRSACVLSVQRIAHGLLGISLREHFRHTLARFQVPILLYAGTFAAGRLLFSLDSYVALVLLAVIATVLYVGSSWKLAFDDVERATLRNLVHGFKARLR